MSEPGGQTEAAPQLVNDQRSGVCGGALHTKESVEPRTRSQNGDYKGWMFIRLEMGVGVILWRRMGMGKLRPTQGSPREYHRVTGGRKNSVARRGRENFDAGKGPPL